MFCCELRILFKHLLKVQTKGAFKHFVKVPDLVRESIANLCMDFQKSTDINMDIHDFWMLVFTYPYKRGYQH